jgi:hypothetical protein
MMFILEVTQKHQNDVNELLHERCFLNDNFLLQCLQFDNVQLARIVLELGA